MATNDPDRLRALLDAIDDLHDEHTRRCYTDDGQMLECEPLDRVRTLAREIRDSLPWERA